MAYVVQTMIAFLFLSFFATCAFSSQIITTNDYRYIYRAWPELEGQPVDQVATEILRDHPQLKIKVRSGKYGITPSIEPDTVILYEDEEGRVLNRPETVEKIPIQVKTWPEVVGLTADEAKSVILAEMPEAEIEIVEAGTPVTLDLRYNRVRIFVNADNVVIEPPATG